MKNKTQIFKYYSEFYNREDKEINGVNQEFADQNPEWEKMNETNDGCWNCSRCSRCSGCSGCSGCYDCSGCSSCSGCSGCSGCSRCYDCSRCSGCFDCSRCSRCSSCSGCSGCYDCYGCYDCSRCSSCSGCSGCSGCSSCSGCYDCSGCSSCSSCSGLIEASPAKNEDSEFKIPVIEDIHQKLLEAINDNGNKLEMSDWHTCETTHCRAGWVEHLAGTDGKALAEKTTILFAAMQIYHKSCPEIPVSPTRFYESNTIAMADIVRCAEEERKLNKSN